MDLHIYKAAKKYFFALCFILAGEEHPLRRKRLYALSTGPVTAYPFCKASIGLIE